MRTEDTDAQDNTELGREFRGQPLMVGNTATFSVSCKEASVSLRKDCFAHTEQWVGSCARRAGGP